VRLVLYGSEIVGLTALFTGRLVYDNLKKTILYLLPAGRRVTVLRCSGP
jgi:hypothetical protein